MCIISVINAFNKYDSYFKLFIDNTKTINITISNILTMKTVQI